MAHETLEDHEELPELDEETAAAIEAGAAKAAAAEHADHGGHPESGPVKKTLWAGFGILTVGVFLAIKSYKGLQWFAEKSEKLAKGVPLGGGGGGGGHKTEHGGGGGHGH